MDSRPKLKYVIHEAGVLRSGGEAMTNIMASQQTLLATPTQPHAYTTVISM